MALRDEEVLERIEAAIHEQSENVNRLTENLHTVVHTMDRFVAGLKARPTKRQFWFVMVLVLIGLWFNWTSSRSNHQVIETVNDCVTPTGQCSKRNAQATGTAILQIQCLQVFEINELAEKNKLVPIVEPPECTPFKRATGR